MWDLVLGWAARFLAAIFKDWRRDEALVEKGRVEQRDDNLEEGERRRKDADQIKRDAEGADAIVGDDEL